MRNKEKIIYETDPHNKLIAKKTGKASGVTGYRQVLDGQFKTGKGNSLAYHVKKSSHYDIPQQVKLFGRYSLDRDRNLVFTLNKWNNQVEGNKLIIKGQLLDAKDDELSFTVGTRDSLGNAAIHILKLSGAWQADKNNRLSFNVTREKGSVDNLLLEGAWKVNGNNEIVYAYTKTRLKTKEKITNALTFKGYWDITEKCRISYVLNKEIDSRFDFKVGFIRPTKSSLEYKISVGAKHATKTLSLCGKWKLSKRSELLFEIPYEGGEIQGIAFGANCRLNENNTINLKLKNRRGEDLGISLRLSRKILKDQGEIFMQALREEKELSLLTGIGFRW
ncbi:MAG: hypothetical protein KKD90_06465 [Candidatus Omnitrophica bacterium]|nr:hypothetical protein [Candidatus Omnitrophota bacterium]MBU4149443.1 hypothetical protein [Candidatus Omnitrophota bacterium]